MSELAHGLLLQEQGRLEEAEACFYQVLAREPENEFVYGRLALCQLNQPGKKREALRSIERAIQLRPDEAFYHSVRSLALADLRRGKESLESAEAAIALNPEDTFAVAAKANAFCSAHRWAEGEEWSRRALALDSDNSMATNLLAHTLRMQGKADENRVAVEQLLAADPESSLAHVNAGWGALQGGDSPKAETHFREALRIDPDSEMAREGLLESFRARSVFYRGYLSYIFFLQRFTQGKKWIIVFGVLITYQVSWRVLERFSSLAAIAVGLLFFAFVLWVWLAPGVGNFLILMDRSARFALRPGERGKGIAVGGGVLVGMIAVGAGLILSLDSLSVLGAGFFASTIPASLAWGNETRAGRFVFGGITIALYLMSLILPWFEWRGEVGVLHTITSSCGVVALILVVSCTWLGNIRGLRSQPED